MGKRCLQSGPRGPAPKISPARKGWANRQAVERRRCGTTLFLFSLGLSRGWTSVAFLMPLPGAAHNVVELQVLRFPPEFGFNFG
jgi:hypothetical protein